MREKLRAGNYYHIYNRGNNRENIFKEAINYQFFLQKYAQYCYPVLETYAYCLLKNHFHLLIRVLNPKQMTSRLLKSHKKLRNKDWSPQLVSQQLGHFFNSYTQAVNKKYERTGSLFERPFERKQINADSYFCNLVCYIHQNPQLHGFTDDFREYSHSSYTVYLSEGKTRINTAETLSRFGGKQHFEKAHDDFAKLSKEIKIEE